MAKERIRGERQDVRQTPTEQADEAPEDYRGFDPVETQRVEKGEEKKPASAERPTRGDDYAEDYSRERQA